MTPLIHNLSPFVPRGIKNLIKSFGRTQFKWKYFDNFIPWMNYQFHFQPLQEEQSRILKELNKKGIAISSAEKLFGSSEAFEELRRQVALQEQKAEKQISQVRAESDELKSKKGFIFELLNGKDFFSPKDIFVRFAIQPAMLEISNAYFGMLTSLRFFNIWRTFPIKGEPRRSQLWHQDPEDKFILKIFVYLSDVDEGAGPFIYASGSHPKGNVREKPQCFQEEGHSAWRCVDEEMQKVISREKWIHCTGPAGTIVFADTRGFHKGGLARTKERLSYNFMFVSQNSKTRWSYVQQKSMEGLSPIQKIAVENKERLEEPHLIEGKISGEEESSVALKYRALFAQKLRDKDASEICRRYARLSFRELQKLIHTGEKYVLKQKLKGRGIEMGSGTALASSVLISNRDIQHMYCIDYVKELVSVIQPKVINAYVSAHLKSHITRMHGSFDSIDLPDESLDFVIEVESWHHSSCLNRSVREAYRVLKPGGVILGFDRVQPNEMTDQEVNELLNHVYDEDFLKRNGYPAGIKLTRRINGEHEYREREWRTAFEKAGFQTIKFKSLYKNVPLFLPHENTVSYNHFKKWLKSKIDLRPYSPKTLTCFACVK